MPPLTVRFDHYVARRCWICGAGMNGTRGSTVSPQLRGQSGKFHCVRCRHFVEGLVWWYVSTYGRAAKDFPEDFESGWSLRCCPFCSPIFENFL